MIDAILEKQDKEEKNPASEKHPAREGLHMLSLHEAGRRLQDAHVPGRASCDSGGSGTPDL